MRILIDTNILFSALLFPQSRPAQALLRVAGEHDMVLCEYNVAEFKEVVRRKAPKSIPDAEELLARMPYELLPVEDSMGKPIRDPKDQPILNSAIAFGVDIILTGDKDFLSLGLKHPRCMTPAEFLELKI